MIYSPLRYPGGKNKLSAFIAKICIDNSINGHYVEPYSGGASVALFLLIEGFVEKITINDKDKSIYAFWHSVLYRTDELCELIEKAELNIQEWREQRAVQFNKDNVDTLKLGFSTFYLNRTNRSGIIYSGVIGGIEQNGNYKMNCRFNKVDLINRIKTISKYKSQISLYNLDALDLIDKIKSEAENSNIVFYFDPPYYLKASSLYLNHYDPEDHKKVSEKILGIKNLKWIVSYDNVNEIKDLYVNCSKKQFAFKHTAYEVRQGREVLFFSNNIQEPDIDNYNPLKFKRLRNGTTANIVYKQ